MKKSDPFTAIVPKMSFTLIGFVWTMNRAGVKSVGRPYVQAETNNSDVAMDWVINKFKHGFELGHYIIWERDFSHKTEFTHTHFYCVDCSPKFGSLKRIPYSAHTPGYATEYDTDKKICYECCAKRDRAHMKEHGKIMLYLCEEGNRRRLSNWGDSLSYNVLTYSRSHHNIARTRIDVWFRDDDGALWWGVNYGDSQITRCRRIKRETSHALRGLY